ncbi:MAG TPA: radical SAM protein [Magnetococcales bacterium]|nr:radical SAM protein [Magnetococcales bacterium]
MNFDPSILLLNLPHDLDDPDNCDSLAQPYGLAVISSFLKSKGWKTILCDAHAEGMKREEILRYALKINPTLLGLTVYTCHLPQIISFLGQLKAANSNIKTVLGGPHPSSKEYRSLLTQHANCVDICVLGEGEYVLHQIAERIKNQHPLDGIKGIAFRKENGDLFYGGHSPMIQDLDAMPFADWDSLPMDRYWAVSTDKKNFANIMFNRGCMGKCTFCASRVVLGEKIRTRSPDSILDEIKILYEKHGVRELAINDATFNVDNQWARDVSSKIIAYNKPDLIWGCNLRADAMDRETLVIMKRSGLTNVFIGVESGDDEMLLSMCKGTTVAMIQAALDMLDDVGIKVYCGFVLGMPGETEESLKRTLSFAKTLSKYSVAFSLATPFPGTTFYRKAMSEGFKVEDWSRFDYHSIPYVPKGLTRKQLFHYYNRTVLRYYLSFNFIIRQIKQMRSWLQLKKTVRLGVRILIGRRKKMKQIEKMEVEKASFKQKRT